jgi:hypothetical protein
LRAIWKTGERGEQERVEGNMEEKEREESKRERERER